MSNLRSSECLFPDNSDVREWFNSVGEEETYRQYILHNYDLPRYSDYKRVSSEAPISRQYASAYLANYVDMSNFSVEHLQKLSGLSDTALAAFWQSVFYFSDSIDKKELNEELFHSIFQTLTLPEERTTLYSIADTLLTQRLKRIKQTRAELKNIYDKQLGRDVSWEYILEEELAKNFVNWITYGGTIQIKKTLGDIWKDKEKSFVDKLIDTLVSFVERFKTLKEAYNTYPVELSNYFRAIKEGKFTKAVKDSDNVISRSYPSLSSIVVQINGSSQIFSTVEQATMYNRISNLVNQIMSFTSGDGVTLMSEENSLYEMELEEAVFLAVDTYINNSVEPSSPLYKALFKRTLNGTETRPAFHTMVEDVIRIYKEKEAYFGTPLDRMQDVEEEVGGFFAEFVTSEANEINPETRVSREMQNYISTTIINESDPRSYDLEVNVLTAGNQTERRTISLVDQRLADPSLVFNAVAAVTANTPDAIKKLSKLVVYTRDVEANIETRSFLDRVLREVFRNGDGSVIRTEEDLNRLKDILRVSSQDNVRENILYSSENTDRFVLYNSTILNMFRGNLDFYTSNVKAILVDKDSRVYSYAPLMTNARNRQIESWEKTFRGLPIDFIQEKMNRLNEISTSRDIMSFMHSLQQYEVVDEDGISQKVEKPYAQKVKELRDFMAKGRNQVSGVSFVSSQEEAPAEYDSFEAFSEALSLFREQMDILFDLYGVKVSSNYKKWLAAHEFEKTFFPLEEQDSYMRSILPEDYLEIFDTFNVNKGELNINWKEFNVQANQTFDNSYFGSDGVLADNRDPFSPNFEHMYSLVSTFTKIAYGNTFFDETTLPGTYRNTEDKDIYRFENVSFALKFMNEILPDRELFDKFVSFMETKSPTQSMYVRDNLYTEFHNNLTRSELNRLAGFSSAGISKDDNGERIGVATNMDERSFLLYQYGIVLTDAYIVRNQVKQGNKIVSAAIVTVPYHKGMSETSKTKSFVPGPWLKGSEHLNKEGEKVWREMIDISESTGRVQLKVGSLPLAKRILQQEVSRVSYMRNLMESLFSDSSLLPQAATFGQENLANAPKAGDRQILNITQSDLLEAIRRKPEFAKDLEYIYEDYHTGRIVFEYKEGTGWTIPLSVANESSFTARGLKLYTSTISPFVSEKGRQMLYDRLNEEGAVDLANEDYDTRIELDQEITATLSAYLSEEIELMKNLGVVESLDSRYEFEESNDDNTKTLGFKYSEAERLPTERVALDEIYVENLSPSLLHNLAMVSLNNLFVRNSIQSLFHGDPAILLKDSNREAAKRNKRERSSFYSAYHLGSTALGVRPMTELRYITKSGREQRYQDSAPRSSLNNEAFETEDGQAYSSVDSRKRLMFSRQKLKPQYIKILNKIHNGQTLTTKENNIFFTTGFVLNSAKTIAPEMTDFLKFSEVMLTKELTSRFEDITENVGASWINYVDFHDVIEENGKIVSFTIYPRANATREITIDYNTDIPLNSIEDLFTRKDVRVREWFSPFDNGQDSLHDDRKILDGWVKNSAGKYVYSGRENSSDLMVLASASKAAKPNVLKGSLSEFDPNFHIRSISARDYGLQVENPVHESTPEPSQNAEILTNGIDNKEVVDKFHNTLGYRDQVATAINERLLVDENGDLNKSLLARSMHENMLETNGDRQLLDFTSLNDQKKPKFNFNIPPMAVKAQYQFNSIISESFLKHKIAGDAYAMVSATGNKLLKKLRIIEYQGTKLYSWDVIRKDSEEYNRVLAESNVAVLPDNLTYNSYEYLENKNKQPELNTFVSYINKEETKLNDGDYFFDDLRFHKPVIDPNGNLNYFTEAVLGGRSERDYNIDLNTNPNKYISGVRIPSQDKSTAVNIEVVDYLPRYYRNSIMVAKEIQQLAGSDFDIDKIFTHFYAGYWVKGQFVPYTDTYTGFKEYMMRENKLFRILLNDRLNDHPRYKQSLRERKIAFTQLRQLEKNLINNEDLIFLYDQGTYDLTNHLKVARLTLSEDVSAKEKEKAYKELEEWNNRLLSLSKDYSDNGSPAAMSIVRTLATAKEYISKTLEYEEIKDEAKNIRTREAENLLKEKFPEVDEKTYGTHNSLIRTLPAVSNDILDQKKVLLTYNNELYKNLISTEVPKTMFKDDTPKNNFHKVVGLVLQDDIKFPYSSLGFDAESVKAAQAGNKGITQAVTGNLAWLVNVRAGTKLSKQAKFSLINVAGKASVAINGFEHSLKTLPVSFENLREVSSRISEIISASTDEAKEGSLNRLNLRASLLSLYLTGISIGIDHQAMIAILNRGEVQSYVNNSLRNQLSSDLIPSMATLIRKDLKSFLSEDKTIEEFREENNKFDFQELMNQSTREVNLGELLPDLSKAEANGMYLISNYQTPNGDKVYVGKSGKSWSLFDSKGNILHEEYVFPTRKELVADISKSAGIGVIGLGEAEEGGALVELKFSKVQASVELLGLLDKLLLISEQNNALLRFIRTKKGIDEYEDFRKIEEDIEKMGWGQGEATYTAYSLKLDAPGMGQIKNFVHNIFPKMKEKYEQAVLEATPQFRGVEEEFKTKFKIFDFSERNRHIKRALLGAMLRHQSLLLNKEESESDTIIKEDLPGVELLIGPNSLGQQFLYLQNETPDDVKTILRGNSIFDKLTTVLAHERKVSAVLQQAKRNRSTKDLSKSLNNIIDVDTFSLNLFSKMSTEVQSNLMDAFNELFFFNKSAHPEINEKVKEFARNLFKYLTIKDGLEFNPAGLNKIIIPEMYQNVSALYDAFMTLDTKSAVYKAIKKDALDSLHRDVRLRRHTLATTLDSSNLKTKKVVNKKNEEKEYTIKKETYYQGLLRVRSVRAEDTGEETPLYVYRRIKKSKEDNYYATKLFKLVTNNHSIPKNPDLKEAVYVEVPFVGSPNYNSTLASTNIVANIFDALSNSEDVQEAFKTLVDENQKELALAVRKTFQEEVSDLKTIRIVTPDGTDVTPEDLKEDTRNLKTEVVPFSDLSGLRPFRVTSASLLHPRSQNEFTVDGKLFYSIRQYVDYQLGLYLSGGTEDSTTRAIYLAKGNYKPISFGSRVNENTKADFLSKRMELFAEAYKHALENNEKLRENFVSIRSRFNIITGDAFSDSISDILNSITMNNDGDLNFSALDNLSFLHRSDIQGFNVYTKKRDSFLDAVWNAKSSKSTFILSNSKNKNELAYQLAHGLLDKDTERVNPDPTLVAGKVVLATIDSRYTLTPDSLIDYMTQVFEYLDNGAILMTSTDNRIYESNFDNNLTRTPQADGLNGGEFLLNYNLRKSGYTPKLSYIYDTKTKGAYPVYLWSSEAKMNDIMEEYDVDIEVEGGSGFEVTTLSKVPLAEKIKAPFKSRNSSGYIGYGKIGSSTAYYASQYKAEGLPVNPETYRQGETYFASINGDGTDFDKTFREIKRALNSGASVLLDSKKYIDSSKYNEKGEGALFKALKSEGFTFKTTSNENVIIWSNKKVKETEEGIQEETPKLKSCKR